MNITDAKGKIYTLNDQTLACQTNGMRQYTIHPATDAILQTFRLHGITQTCLPEYHFHSVRRWRFDYAFPDQMLYVEVDGGLYVQGGHARGWRLTQEHEKHNEAAVLGWRGLRTQPKLIRSAQFIEVLRRALGQ